MKQRKFEIVINENIERDNSVVSTVSMRIGNEKDGCKVADYKYEVSELTEENIVEAVNKLMYYMLPTISAKDVEAPKTGTVFKRTPDGKFVLD